MKLTGDCVLLQPYLGKTDQSFTPVPTLSGALYEISSLFLQEAQAYAEENSLLFMETSAKTAMNVNDIFLAIGKSV